MLHLNSKTAACEFKRILKNIDAFGLESQPRDQKVKESFFEMMVIDPLFPLCDFSARPVNWRYTAGELMWYLSKESDPMKILPFSKFWDKLRNPNGTVNSNYGNLLFGKQLRWVYDSLCKDKDSRQAIAFLNESRFQYPENKDFVCTLNLLFFIRNNELNMRVNIRSNDMIRGFSFDAPFFSFILQDMYLWLKETKYPELFLGTYYHFADNIHYYEEHYDIIDKISKEESIAQPIFSLKDRIFDIGESGEFTLRLIAEKFMQNVQNLAESGVKEQEPYLAELMNIFEIYPATNITYLQ